MASGLGGKRALTKGSRSGHFSDSVRIPYSPHLFARRPPFRSMNDFLPFAPVVAVLLMWAERMRELATKRDTVPGKRQENWTFRLFVFCGAGMVAGGIAEYFLGTSGPHWLLFAAGVLLSIASFVIRRKSIGALGKFWSLHVEMRAGHEFVRTGPFRWVRHPVYFSMILELLGPALMLRAWWTLAIVSAVFIPTLVYRLRIEEAAMIGQFGEAYREYRNSTPMLLPTRFPRA